MDGKYLITKRPTKSHLGGFWEFPGGKVKEGESYTVALAREILEETNLTVEVGDLFHEIFHEYEDRNIRLLFYNSTILSGDPLPLECDEIKWISKNEFPTYNFPPADAELVKLLSAN
ncbi:MAG: (deoxy)nucleoside triphosphate pyrophosphohydrolase [Candidatus Marinimicrobia bacterium]|nr:(deoxy)nucleoside triphosphate pyrophosphohydrolase [Candidatus Neomarinimicrobiota bacterium]